MNSYMSDLRSPKLRESLNVSFEEVKTTILKVWYQIVPLEKYRLTIYEKPSERQSMEYLKTTL